jgi:steroid delta-isomerase
MMERTESASSRYFEALNRIDREAYLACFGEEAIVQDPYGGRTFTGREGLNKWFNGMDRTWDRFTMTPGEAYSAGDRLAVQWTAEATSKQGKTARFAGINVFTIGEDGLIRRLEGYWDAAAMMAQLG